MLKKNQGESGIASNVSPYCLFSPVMAVNAATAGQSDEASLQ